MAGRFPLLTDEHVPRSLVLALRRLGWVVVRVVDLETVLGQGADDEQVFTYAIEQSYVVLSSDERALWRPKGYLERGHRFPGMVCWPQRHQLLVLMAPSPVGAGGAPRHTPLRRENPRFHAPISRRGAREGSQRRELR